MYRLIIACSFFLPFSLFSQMIDTSASLAGQYFKEAQDISKRDQKKLWGYELYGPMIFVDRNSGKAIANEPDSAGTFQQAGTVYIGNVPKSFGSNTANFFGG